MNPSDPTKSDLSPKTDPLLHPAPPVEVKPANPPTVSTGTSAATNPKASGSVAPKVPGKVSADERQAQLDKEAAASASSMFSQQPGHMLPSAISSPLVGNAELQHGTGVQAMGPISTGPAASTAPEAGSPMEYRQLAENSAISAGSLLMYFIRHPNVFVIIANSAPALYTGKTYQTKWESGLRPIGDVVFPTIDELLGNVSQPLGLPANQTPESLESELLIRIQGMPHALGVDGEGRPRLFNREMIGQVARMFLQDILPMLLRSMKPL